MTAIEVSAAVVWKGPRVLLARRSPGRREAGKWEFPGGKREAHETLAESLVRELKEEFSVRAVVGEELLRSEHSYPHGRICLVAFRTVLLDEPLASTDHDRIDWVSLDHLLGYELSEADVPVARFLFQTL
jgi:8-oxo-dGTP diphosphatase